MLGGIRNERVTRKGPCYSPRRSNSYTKQGGIWNIIDHIDRSDRLNIVVSTSQEHSVYFCNYTLNELVSVATQYWLEGSVRRNQE